MINRCAFIGLGLLSSCHLWRLMWWLTWTDSVRSEEHSAFVKWQGGENTREGGTGRSSWTRPQRAESCLGSYACPPTASLWERMPPRALMLNNSISSRRVLVRRAAQHRHLLAEAGRLPALTSRSEFWLVFSKHYLTVNELCCARKSFLEWGNVFAFPKNLLIDDLHDLLMSYRANFLSFSASRTRVSRDLLMITEQISF